MKNLMIDTLGYAEALEQSGFSREQAKGAAKALNNTVGEELATKADLAQLGGELRTEMAQLGSELRAEIADTRTGLSAEINELRTEITEVKGDIKLLRWMLGIVVIAVVIPLVRDFLL